MNAPLPPVKQGRAAAAETAKIGARICAKFDHPKNARLDSQTAHTKLNIYGITLDSNTYYAFVGNFDGICVDISAEIVAAIWWTNELERKSMSTLAQTFMQKLIDKSIFVF